MLAWPWKALKLGGDPVMASVMLEAQGGIGGNVS